MINPAKEFLEYLPTPDDEIKVENEPLKVVDDAGPDEINQRRLVTKDESAGTEEMMDEEKEKDMVKILEEEEVIHSSQGLPVILNCHVEAYMIF